MLHGLKSVCPLSSGPFKVVSMAPGNTALRGVFCTMGPKNLGVTAHSDLEYTELKTLEKPEQQSQGRVKRKWPRPDSSPGKKQTSRAVW